MPNKMLIDASHQEETRVVVTRGSRIEEFDFESQDKKQLRGNIYLARVTRVEPSLQAAFVEYGGNRHGFLAFSEIHPDYYQIPVADRQAILRAEAEAAAEEDEDEDGEERGRGKRRRRGGRRNGDETARAASSDATGSEDAPTDEGEDEASTDGPADIELDEFADGSEGLPAEDEGEDDAAVSDAGEGIAPAPEALTEREDQPIEEADADRAPPSEVPDGDDEPRSGGSSMAAEIEADVVSEPAFEAPEGGRGSIEEVSTISGDEVESVGAEDALEEVQSRRRTPRRHYKIQEVVKRRQILLVQVVKEERGNKGAALTTYLSLAGRYSVLMPNTARGGGISRKITNAVDRKRLKDVVKDLDVPQGMGVILRTAGENRTKPEIKRDYEYLMRLWENVRSLTLRSIAPSLVYEEGSLIKRSVRDLYNKDIDEILVAGEEGYREAKDFMRMLMPSHAKVVQPYRDPTPIFAKSGIESQLDRMLQPQVTLKSGGYIVINQTEALVSIDVNSGRSTREHSIEDTALQTNLEASEEVARQLRLRDLAGLIVIDYIDMEENRNNRAVEKKLKDCLKNDRARIQVGRISHFGLLEMSRQRIRASVLESTMKPCPHCGGTGYVRSDSSVALLVLRAIEEFLLKDSRNHIAVKTPTQTAFYLLNTKRGTLIDFENRFGVAIAIEADETVGHQHYVIVRGAVAEKPLIPAGTEAVAPPIFDEPEAEEEDEVVEPEAEEETEEEDAVAVQGADDGAGDRKRRRKRRRRGGGREREGSVATDATRTVSPAAQPGEAETGTESSEPAAPSSQPFEAADEATDDPRKRRRGKRGGRRNRREDGDQGEDVSAAAYEAEDDGAQPVVAAFDPSVVEPELEEEARPAAARDIETSVSTTDTAAPSLDEEVLAAVEVADSADSGGAAAAAALVSETAVEIPSDPDAEAPASNGTARPPRRRSRGNGDGPVEPVVSSQGETPVDAAERPKKAGWWQRKGFF